MGGKPDRVTPAIIAFPADPAILGCVDRKAVPPAGDRAGASLFAGADPLGFILFFFAAIAEMKRVPFDAPEGESEIVAGYFLEYSGFKFGMFMTGEFLEHIVSGSLIAVLFFGGYDVPFLHSDGFHFAEVIGYDIQLPHVVVVLIGVGSFLLKTFIFVFLFLQVRWTLPRFRYDQIMQLCWKIILPLSLANILITGVVILMIQGG